MRNEGRNVGLSPKLMNLRERALEVLKRRDRTPSQHAAARRVVEMVNSRERAINSSSPVSSQSPSDSA
jgi:hypothetical protein